MTRKGADADSEGGGGGVGEGMVGGGGLVWVLSAAADGRLQEGGAATAGLKLRHGLRGLLHLRNKTTLLYMESSTLLYMESSTLLYMESSTLLYMESSTACERGVFHLHTPTTIGARRKCAFKTLQIRTQNSNKKFKSASYILREREHISVCMNLLPPQPPPPPTLFFFLTIYIHVCLFWVHNWTFQKVCGLYLIKKVGL